MKSKIKIGCLVKYRKSSTLTRKYLGFGIVISESIVMKNKKSLTVFWQAGSILDHFQSDIEIIQDGNFENQ